jgi:ABC-type Fe3+ transport system permease subunit
MKVWEGRTISNLLEAGKDTGWVVAMVLICVCTFAVSSMFVKSGFTRSRGRDLTRHEASLKHTR